MTLTGGSDPLARAGLEAPGGRAGLRPRAGLDAITFDRRYRGPCVTKPRNQLNEKTYFHYPPGLPVALGV